MELAGWAGVGWLADWSWLEGGWLAGWMDV